MAVVSHNDQSEAMHVIKLQIREDVFEKKVREPDSYGGLLTSKFCNPLVKKQPNISERIRKEIKVEGFPKFSGCPDWIKPIMYREYQVSRFFLIGFAANLIFRKSIGRGGSQKTGSAPFSRI